MLASDLQKLQVDGIITLYELDATALGAGIYRWHGHTSFEDWAAIQAWAGSTELLAGSTEWYAGSTETKDEYQVKSDIIWKGEAYSAVPIQSDGLEMRGDGRASSPVLAISSNLNGIAGLTRVLCLRFDDFVGCKLKVTNTLAKYLDAANFASGNEQASTAPENHRIQDWYIEQKTEENGSYVKFELSNPVDFGDARIPSREITSYCHWAVHGRYRGEECGYTGAAMFTEDGLPTDNPEMDKCGGRVSDCQLRFGKGNPIRHGGFPSSNNRI